jgi:group I intron endonuclease
MIIYQVTNLVNGKKYIGKDKNNNPTYLGSGKLITKAIEKYGKNNFQKEILEYCSTYDELRDREVFWIKKFNAALDPDFYNIAEENFGVGNFKGFTEDDWNRFSKKMSKISQEKWKDENFRTNHSDSIKKWHDIMSIETKQIRSKKISDNWVENKQERRELIRIGIQNSELYQNRDLSNAGRKPKVIVTVDLEQLVINMFTSGNSKSQISKITLLSKWQINKILKKVGLLK